MGEQQATTRPSANTGDRLHRILTHYMQAILPDRELAILMRRFGLDGDPAKVTLERLGAEQGVTRERIRQLEERGLNRLRSGLYTLNGSKAAPEVSVLAGAYAAMGEVLAPNKHIVRRASVDRKLFQHLGGEMTQPAVDVLLKMHGFIPFRSARKFGRTHCHMAELVIRSKHRFQDVEHVVNAVSNAMTGVIGSIPVKDVKQAVAQAFRSRRLSEGDFRAVISAIQGLDIKGDELRVQFDYTKSWNEKMYRILTVQKRPMRLLELRNEALRRSTRPDGLRGASKQQVSARLAADPRFNCIGRSGLWKLAAWDHIETMSIWLAVCGVLEKEGKPLPISAIVERTLKLRPDASPNSVVSYIALRPEFMRIKSGGEEKMYGLTKWNLEPHMPRRSVPRLKPGEFAEAARQVLQQQNPIPLRNMVSEIQRRTGLHESLVRQRLYTLEGLKYISVKPYPRKKVSSPDVSQIKERARNSLSMRVTAILREELQSQPGVPYNKLELYKRLTERIKCQRPLYYHCLSAMKDIRQYRDGRYYYAVYDPPAKSAA